MNIAENIGKTRLTNRKEKLIYTNLKPLSFSEILETKHNATCRHRKTPKTISGEILAYGQRQEALQ
jgi:predicted AAA+ superfamily ATPase